MYESFFFLSHKFEFFILIPTIFNIHRPSHQSTKILSLICLFSFSIFNLYNSPSLESKVEFDLLLVLLYSIVTFFYIIITLIISSKHFQSTQRSISEEMYIYDREFKRYGFTNEEYKKFLMKKGVIKRTRNREMIYAKEGDKLDKVYLFIQIPENCYVALKKENVVIFSVEEGSWIGSVECIRDYSESSAIKWDCSIELSNKVNKEVVWIEWENKYMKKMIGKHIDDSLGSKFLFMWGNYLCVINKKLNDYIVKMNKI